jgi:hypothetical protein
MSPNWVASPAGDRVDLRETEWAAWVGLLALSAALRLAGLGNQPLDPEEAGRAMEAWTLWHEGRVAYAAGPIVPNLLSLTFGLFTAGDGQARLVSALAGVAIVGVPFALRPFVGALASWCAALALALCPLLLTLSRIASPTMPMLLCLLVFAVALARYATSQQPGWLLAAAISFFVGLGTDPSFVVGVAGLILATAIAEGDSLSTSAWLPRFREHAPRALFLGLVVALLLDTRLLMNPGGVHAGIFDPLSAWWGNVARGGGLMAPAYVLLVDGGMLALAAIGLLDHRERPRAVRLLGAWLVVAATLAMLVRQPDVRYLAVPLIPAALLAGLGLRRLIAAVRDHGSGRTWALGLAGLVPLLTAGFHLNTSLRSGSPSWLTTAVIAVAGLLVVLLIGINTLRPAQLTAAAATFILAFIGLWTVTSDSRLLESHSSARAHLLFRSVLTDEARIVREDAHRWLRDGPDRPIGVDPSLRPLISWYLRDVPTARYDAALLRSDVGRILVGAPAEIGPDARARRLVIGYAADPATADLRPERLWRWVVGRESLVQVRPYAILLLEPAGS